MKLKVLHKSRYKITAAMDGDKCETETFLSTLETKYQASGDGLLRLIVHIAENGLDGLPPKLCHLVDQQNKIFELIKGDLRLLFFKGHCDILIVTSHGFLKKTQTTPDNHKEKAIQYKKKYERAHDDKNIDLIEDQED